MCAFGLVNLEKLEGAVNLRLKKTATLMIVQIVSSGFLLFVMKKKVKWPFLGAVKSSSPSLQHITPRIEKALIKSKSVLKCWDSWLSNGLFDNNVIKWKVLCFVGFYSKV